MHHTKTDAAVRSPEQHRSIQDAIAQRKAVDAACTRRPAFGMPFDRLEAEYPNLAKVVADVRAEDAAVSMVALAAKYPKVRDLIQQRQKLLAALKDMLLSFGSGDWTSVHDSARVEYARQVVAEVEGGAE